MDYDDVLVSVPPLSTEEEVERGVVLAAVR